MTRRTYIGRASTPAAATVDTAGEGGFYGVCINAGPNSVTSAVLASVNLVKVYQFVLPFRAIVRNLTFEIEVLSVGGLCSVGLYSADGNILRVHSGAVSTTTTGIKNVVASAVTLEPGVYFHSWTGDNITFKLRSFVSAQGWNNLINNNANRVGSAANPSVAGVLPATLGAITPTAANTPAVYYAP